MRKLPIDASIPRIVESVTRHGNLVLIAAPGAGKTTRVPPALLKAGFAERGSIVVLQPRRIAAQAAASRIAEERGWRLGQEVGYQVRFENRSGPETRLRIMTEGILLRRLQNDPSLEDVSAVIVDEFHERSLDADLCLALAREVQRTLREDLAIVVMSATLDPLPVSKFLGGCPVIEVEGRPHPVDIGYQPRGLRDPLDDAVETAVRSSWGISRGHALIFLPGVGEIRQAARALEKFARSVSARVLPLHGGLSLDEQRAVLSPSPERKIILSTNVAETSVTIDGVDLVIDSGLVRLLRNDPSHGIDRLDTERVSRYSADQRSGRAGRLGPGHAIRLWSSTEHGTLAKAPPPEVRRVDLSRAVLELRAWGVTRPLEFGWYEPPDAAAVERAQDLLLALGAIQARNGPLTDVGDAMRSLPAHPRIARILLAARSEDCCDEAVILAALLEERDILRRDGSRSRGSPEGREAVHTETGASDLLDRLDVYRQAEAADFRPDTIGALGLDAGAVWAVRRSSRELRRLGRWIGEIAKPRAAAKESEEEREEALLRILLLGYPDRVVRRRAMGSDRGRMVGGRGVALARESSVREGEFFLALDLDESVRGERVEARVRLASRIERRWIESSFPQHIHEETRTYFDARLEKVRATATICYLDLPLEDPRERRPHADEAERILTEAVRERAEGIVAGDKDLEAWLTRVRCLARWRPELGLPNFDAQGIARVLTAVCAGRTSLAELRKAGLLRVFQGTLSYDQLAAVSREAPETLEVPSGSRIRLAYEPGKPPVLAVRLQEMFGLGETPRIAGGKVPVLLHLLGPNYRPVQITQDLHSFWNSTYERVRKDLRGRYPKHHWPEDPWKARPERGAKRRR